jgi:phosphatidylglycerophosphatase A
MHLSKIIVSCCGIGLIPKAPGTWGSIPGIALGWLVFNIGSALYPWGNLLLLIAATGFAWWAIRWFECVHGVHDESSTVIDEVVGMAIGVGFCEPGMWNYLIGFVFFRILDIRKPGLIGWADRSLPGAHGTLLDDVFAGMITSAMIALLGVAWS